MIEKINAKSLFLSGKTVIAQKSIKSGGGVNRKYRQKGCFGDV